MPRRIRSTVRHHPKQKSYQSSTVWGHGLGVVSISLMNIGNSVIPKRQPMSYFTFVICLARVAPSRCKLSVSNRSNVSLASLWLTNLERRTQHVHTVPFQRAKYCKMPVLVKHPHSWMLAQGVVDFDVWLQDVSIFLKQLGISMKNAWISKIRNWKFDMGYSYPL